MRERGRCLTTDPAQRAASVTRPVPSHAPPDLGHGHATGVARGATQVEAAMEATINNDHPLVTECCNVYRIMMDV